MARPNASPNTQNSNPINNSLWPSIPRKLTELRSGRVQVRFASALAGLGDGCGAS